MEKNNKSSNIKSKTKPGTYGMSTNANFFPKNAIKKIENSTNNLLKLLKNLIIFK